MLFKQERVGSRASQQPGQRKDGQDPELERGSMGGASRGSTPASCSLSPICWSYSPLVFLYTAETTSYPDVPRVLWLQAGWLSETQGCAFWQICKRCRSRPSKGLTASTGRQWHREGDGRVNLGQDILLHWTQCVSLQHSAMETGGLEGPAVMSCVGSGRRPVQDS